MSRVRASAIGWLCLPFALLAAGVLVAATIDTAASAIGFTLKTRWGQTLEGVFPRYEGDIETLDDGHHRVRLTLSARDVEIVGYRSYTRLTRGKGFFDAERFPEMRFVSDPYPVALTRDGGPLGGDLTIRGVRRREVFTIEPATCDRPGVGCDVVAGGSVSRSDYGVDRWAFALSDKVTFALRIRVREGDGVDRGTAP